MVRRARVILLMRLVAVVVVVAVMAWIIQRPVVIRIGN